MDMLGKASPRDGADFRKLCDFTDLVGLDVELVTGPLYAGSRSLTIVLSRAGKPLTGAAVSGSFDVAARVLMNEIGDVLMGPELA